jgi:hypothetical protein
MGKILSGYMYCIIVRMLVTKHRVHRVEMVTFWRTFYGKIRQPGEGGRWTPSPFTLSTITSQVVVYAPAERETLPLFLLFSSLYSVLLSQLRTLTTENVRDKMWPENMLAQKYKPDNISETEYWQQNVWDPWYDWLQSREIQDTGCRICEIQGTGNRICAIQGNGHRICEIQGNG